MQMRIVELNPFAMACLNSNHLTGTLRWLRFDSNPAYASTG